MASNSFSAQVDDFVHKSLELLEAVAKESIERFADEANTPIAKGGNLPVDSGFLRNSIVVTLHTPTGLVAFKEGDESVGYSANYEATIQGMDLGDSVYGVWTANYARYVHDGVGGRVGRQWVTLAGQRWQTIVNEVVSEVRR